MKDQLRTLTVVALLLLGACNIIPTPRVTEKPAEPQPKPVLKPTGWDTVEGWRDDEIVPALDAFLQSCTVLKKKALWQEACIQADSVRGQDSDTVRQFFESYFVPYQVLNPDGTENGLITGYYEPLLKGSRTPSARYRYPLYTTPEELLIVDLSSVYPQLKNMRLRGRLEGRKVVPFYSRAEISSNPPALQGKELLWVDDEVDLFFLQIQGSGRVELENGEIVRVGYADQNGHPYRSIGKLLVDRGELPLERASMQGIKAWGQKNPRKLPNILHQNSSFVFFRELPDTISGPLGSMGVPLTAGRSLAVDPRVIPQGAPVFLSTTWPNTDEQLQRLMVAQDTGGAIKGNVRADFFWGFGPDAAEKAGKMRQTGRMWVLMPVEYMPQDFPPAARILGSSK